jgi:Polysaccharide deacetylase
LVISSKRDRLAGMLSRLGLVRAISWLPRRPQLTVFNYHRIGWIDENPYDDAIFSASPAGFRAQLQFLRKYFDLPPLDEVVAAVSAGAELKRPTALITFDDGYRDNYELAFPVLKECGVPAVFFIPTDFVACRGGTGSRTSSSSALWGLWSWTFPSGQPLTSPPLPGGGSSSACLSCTSATWDALRTNSLHIWKNGPKSPFQIIWLHAAGP